MPSWSFRSRFAPHHDQWPFICRRHHVILLLAVLQQWSLILLSVWLVWHISSYCQVQDSKAMLVLRSWCTGLWRLGLFAEVRLWRRYPLVEEIIFYIDKFKSCTLRRHLSFSDFGCILCHVIIVLCIVFVQCLVSTLQMQRHCIHVAFERGC